MNRLAAMAAIVVACVAGTVAMSLQGVDGWGWLIFIALVALLS